VLPPTRSLALALLLAAAPPEVARAAASEGQPGCSRCPPAASAAAAPGGASAARAQVKVVDRVLRDQHGARLRFGADVVAGEVVVMDFVFTTCTTICPLLTAKFARVQAELGDRLGKGVKLVSVSLDPVRDTPDRLEAYAARHKAGPHWTFLTGPKDDVDEVLKGLGAYVADFAAHPPMVLVGDGRSGRWVRVNGFPDPKKIVELVDELIASRKSGGATGERS
jgi:protein SCO1